MVELNEIALENVVGGKVSQCAKNFGMGFIAPYAIIGIYGHDAVVSQEKRIAREPRSVSIGFLAGTASLSALSIGAYEGGKHLYKKIKSKLSSK